jgi:hypothetical protein
MEYIEDIGCLTQRSQIDRLQELADISTRQRLRRVEQPSALATTMFVIGSGGEESTWELDHVALASESVALTERLQLEAEEALANLLPTQTVLRILRDTRATAAALVAPIATGVVALQLADADHEESLTARIDRPSDGEPTLGKWDFGKVAWVVRLRYGLRAARSSNESTREAQPRPPVAAAQVRASDPLTQRRNHRREMREQLHRMPAAAPSWLP